MFKPDPALPRAFETTQGSAPAISVPPLRAPAGRDVFIDALRGFAALAVLAFHLFAPVDASVLPPLVAASKHLVSFGYLGVPVFFVVSGYCVGRTWLVAVDPFSFLKRRLRRLLPPYFASVLLVLAVVAATWLLTGVNDVTPLPRTPLAWLATATLWTAPASSVHTVNWVYWSLTCEITFYALLACFLRVRPAARIWVLFASVVASAVVRGTALNVAGTPLFFLNDWPLFVLGVAAAMQASQGRHAAALAAFALLAACLSPATSRGLALIAALIGLITWAAIGQASRFSTSKGVHRLAGVGAISYSLYLIHVPVGVYCAGRFLPSASGHGIVYLLCHLLIAGLCLGAAVGFHHLVEKPFTRSPSIQVPASPLIAA